VDGIKRPLGIWIIVILQAFNALMAIADVVVGTTLSGGELARMASGDAVLRAAVLVWAGLVLAGTVSLFLLRRRGWALMMLLVGISLIIHLAIYWTDAAATQWLTMGVAVVTAFYLNSASVRGLFLRRHDVSRISIGSRAEQ